MNCTICKQRITPADRADCDVWSFVPEGGTGVAHATCRFGIDSGARLRAQQTAHPEPGMEPPAGRLESAAIAPQSFGVIGTGPRHCVPKAIAAGVVLEAPPGVDPRQLLPVPPWPPLANPAQPADTPSPTGGLRYNAGKPRYDLLPADALDELVKVFTRGAEKYAPRNWEKGMAWSETCFAALQRHAWKWQAGEDIDPETGCQHMAHAAWNALALVAYSLRGVGQDDRPVAKLEAPHEP